METNRNLHEKVTDYLDVVRGVGEVVLGSVRRFLNHVNTEPTEAHSTHFKHEDVELVVEHPKPNVHVYRPGLPKANPVVPDILGRDV